MAPLIGTHFLTAVSTPGESDPPSFNVLSLCNMTNEHIIWKQNIVLQIFLHKNQIFFQSLMRNRDKLGLVLNPRDGLEERDGVILFDITNTSYNYIKLINTTLNLIIPMREVIFSWHVARENLTEGSLSHRSQFLKEHWKLQMV